METTRTVRLPSWLNGICKEAVKTCGADNFSCYIRGMILKHAVSLNIPIPPDTQDEWPEWIMKPEKTKPHKESPREIEGF
jgi:hypothetical protein